MKRRNQVPKKSNIKEKKVLILGSGALKIGEAGEFDYSGSQAIKALKEEGVCTVLINPNIATIQTSDYLADKVYFLPVNPEFVEKVIKKERPDGILLSFGGQTALNCGVELFDKGVFSKYNVKVLGTPVQSIKDTEDRQLFVDKLNEINLLTPRSKAVTNIKDALIAAKEIGYPIMTRVAYALGGRGSGIFYNEASLKTHLEKAFSHSKQILVEECLVGWKEVEYEVVRDRFDNCITVCNMENLDPMGVHTGESIVVAPSQTLTNEEYHFLREVSIKLIRHVGIVGECNVQFAFNPNSLDYRIIEVNARLSRSSALASKATGYPLAFVAAKLALGFCLIDLRNSITKSTTACFEPALDYIVLKMPRWDLQKFRGVIREIGSEMKSVGEVMAIGRSFEEVLQKAIRMTGTGMKGMCANNVSFDNLETELRFPTDQRILALGEAIRRGYSIDKIHDLTKIDRWFLYKIKNIVDVETILQKKTVKSLDKITLLRAKQHGFSDQQIAVLCKAKEFEIRRARKLFNITPFVKQIDTLGAEYPARTNYLYLTYHGEEHDIKFVEKKKVIVLGSGAYRIGSSVEFDWCCVNAVLTLRKLGYTTIMLNYNPETVSTDYDECDKLYFDEISYEVVLDLFDLESPLGIIVSMGGQIPNNLALLLHKAKIPILGTSPISIDKAEDRNKFSKLLDELKIDQPEWKELSSISEAESFASMVSYPVLIRPSYVLSGAAMNVAFDKENLKKYLEKAADINREQPVVISKFITNAKEIEIDAVANKGKIVAWAISEHIENAGVHSGDATMVLPPYNLYLETIRRIRIIANKLAAALEITGPFNIQFLAKDNDVKIIECNLRASRSFPFVSKVTGHNFIDLATKAMIGLQVKPLTVSTIDLDYVGVKAPQFSFSRLKGADPITSVEMASTGEVACLGNDIYEALLKSLIAVGYSLPKKNVLISISGDKNRYKFLDALKKLDELGFSLFATEHTSQFLSKNKIPNTKLSKLHEKKIPGFKLFDLITEVGSTGLRKIIRNSSSKSKGNVLDYLVESKLDLVINVPDSSRSEELSDEYLIRRLSIDFSIPLITNLQLADLFVEAIAQKKGVEPEILAWDDYVKNVKKG